MLVSIWHIGVSKLASQTLKLHYAVMASVALSGD